MCLIIILFVLLFLVLYIECFKVEFIKQYYLLENIKNCFCLDLIVIDKKLYFNIIQKMRDEVGVNFRIIGYQVFVMFFLGVYVYF